MRNLKTEMGVSSRSLEVLENQKKKKRKKKQSYPFDDKNVDEISGTKMINYAKQAACINYCGCIT